MTDLDRLPPEIARHRVLDTPSALAFVSLSASQWRDLRSRGEAPKPVQLSSRKQGYRLGDLIDWVAARKAA